MIKCLNCGQEAEHAFCSHCGQKTSTGRLSLHQIYHDLQHILLHIDKGMLKNIQTVWKPDLIIKYIHGQRVGFFNPVLFLLFIAGMVLYTENMFHLVQEVTKPNTHQGTYELGFQVGKAYRNYGKYIGSFLVLPLGLLSFGIFRKETRFNLTENIYIQAFILTNINIIGVLVYPLIRHISPMVAFNWFSVFTLILFQYLVFTQERHRISRLVKSVSVVIGGYLLLLILALGVAALARII